MFCSTLPPVVCRRADVLLTLCLFVCVWWCPTYSVLWFFLSSSCLLCTQFCQFFKIVHFWLPLRYSLTFIYSDLAVSYISLGLSLFPYQILSPHDITVILQTQPIKYIVVFFYHSFTGNRKYYCTNKWLAKTASITCHHDVSYHKQLRMCCFCLMWRRKSWYGAGMT